MRQLGVVLVCVSLAACGQRAASTHPAGLSADAAAFQRQLQEKTGVPLWSAAGGLEYLWRGLAGGDAGFTLQHAYLGPLRCNADSPAQGDCLSIPAFRTGEATNRINARLAWTSRTQVPVTLAVYSNNLFDNRYVTGVQTISATTLGTPFTNITAPRFWGVEVGAHW